MGHAVVAETEVQGQPWSDMPVIVAVEAVVVIDPVLAGEVLQLGEAGGIAEEEVDVRVMRERAVVELGRSLSVGLQLLVLVIVQKAEAKFELVAAFGPRKIVAVLKALVAVFPRIVGFAPIGVERRTLQIDFRQVVADVVGDGEETGGAPAAGQLIAAA